MVQHILSKSSNQATVRLFLRHLSVKLPETPESYMLWRLRTQVTVQPSPPTQHKYAMKIQQIQLYTPDTQSIIIALKTDNGLTGWGECLLTPKSEAKGALAAIAAALLGQEPYLVRKIYRLMDERLTGQPQVKAAIDMACWDLWGQVAERPLYRLLGGQFDAAIALAAVCTTAEEMASYRQYGYDTFLLPMSGDLLADRALIAAAGAALTVGEQLIADAQGKWQLDEARQVAHASQQLDIAFQQPCATYLACRGFQQRSMKALIWSNALANRDLLFRAHEDGALDVVNIDIGREGGLTKAAETRDLCTQLFTPMTFGAASGSEISLMATAHLAASTPTTLRRATVDSTTARGHTFTSPGQLTSNGKLHLSDKAGLGIVPAKERLGHPVAIYFRE